MAELVNIKHPAALDRALREIRSGHVIALPVESGYIFAVDAFNRMAVRSLHLLRNDPEGQAASVMIGDKSRIVGITREISPAGQALIDHFWPGQLSMYLRPHPALTWDLGDQRLLDQIAVRVPNDSFAIELMNETGPLAVASASLAGRKSFAEPSLIDDVFGTTIDVIIEAGRVESEVTSTVVDCTVEPPRIIRQGALDVASLRAVWPSIGQDLG